MEFKVRYLVSDHPVLVPFQNFLRGFANTRPRAILTRMSGARLGVSQGVRASSTFQMRRRPTTLDVTSSDVTN